MKSSAGCWTCRARKKKCDGVQPKCQTCERLWLACAGFDSTKPAWLDGGAKQREYCRVLSTCIKNNSRRPRTITLESDTAEPLSLVNSPELCVDSFSIPDFLGQWPLDEIMPVDFNFSSASDTDWLSTPSNQIYPNVGSIREDYFGDTHNKTNNFDALTGSGVADQGMQQTGQNTEPDWALIMKYFDSHFYHIFPLSCITTRSYLRGWFLFLHTRSEALRLITMGIVSASYVKGADTNLEPEWTDGQTYFRNGIEAINAGYQTLITKNTAHNQRHPMEIEALIVAIIHLIAYQNSPVCNKALLDEGATSHCLQIIMRLFKLLDNGTATPVMESASQMMSKSDLKKKNRAIIMNLVIEWVVIYDAYRGCSSVSPEAIQEITMIIPTNPEHQVSACSSATLLSISQITELASWKAIASQNNTLSQFELAHRAVGLQERLQNELQLFLSMLSRPNDLESRKNERCWGASLADDATWQGLSPAAKFIDEISDHVWHRSIKQCSQVIFVLAAQIYLYAVMSGSNHKLPEIQNAVSQAVLKMKELEQLAVGRNLCMFGLSWPWCIVGCMIGGGSEMVSSDKQWFVKLVKNSSWAATSDPTRLLEVVRQSWKLLESGPVDGLVWSLAILNLTV